MGHYCRICGRERANEQFSGKGHRIHVCKRCQRMPKSKRKAIEDKDDIFGFMHQSHISEKNVARLEQMAKSENPEVASLAAIVLEVARVTPYKKRRLKFLAQKHPELLRKLEDTGLVPAHTWDWEFAEGPRKGFRKRGEVFVREDAETKDLSAEEEWEIPF
jgi:ribosome-binding protein aMBF1 (putative translation factor)